jgi:hypothetical protein
VAFPNNPSNLQTHTEYGRTYQYFTATGTWLATRGAWDYVESDLDLSLITGNSPVALDNGSTYTSINVPYLVTNRVWQSTDFVPPVIPPPTVAITGTTSNLIESSTRSFVVYLTDDHDNTASLTIVGGGGSLSSNTISNGNSVVYTPANVASNTSVTLRATVADIRGATATSDISFTVTDTPAATVAISGNTNFLEANSSRGFTVSQSGDLDGNIQVSIISGQGSLSHSSRTNGQIVTYTNPSYYQGNVTIRARAINYDGEITDSTITFATAASDPTVTLTASSSSISEQGTNTLVVSNLTNDTDNIASVSIVSGGGSLGTTNNSVFTYFPPSVSSSTTVTVRATAENYAGETVTSDAVFTVTDVPVPTVSISGDTTELTNGGTRDFTANHSNDLDGNIQLSIVTGAGTLNTSSVTDGGSFTYDSGSHEGSVTIRATVSNYDGETATSDISFDVAAPIVSISGYVNGGLRGATADITPSYAFTMPAGAQVTFSSSSSGTSDPLRPMTLKFDGVTVASVTHGLGGTPGSWCRYGSATTTHTMSGGPYTPTTVTLSIDGAATSGTGCPGNISGSVSVVSQ